MQRFSWRSGVRSARATGMKIRTLSDYLKEMYGQKVYKIALSSGCTCPNRDGSLMTGGCTFCTAGGSGEFAEPAGDVAELEAQILAAEARVLSKLPADLPPERRKFIAYFQSYTNTYGDINRLTDLYSRVLARPDIVGLSVGTRPDCMGDDVLAMLAHLNAVKPVWVELGLQTAHDETARRIHRGYRTDIYDACVRRLHDAGLIIVTHFILGLPGESREDMLDTVRHVAELITAPDGVKLQMLNILEGSQLAREFEARPFAQMTMEEYCSLVVDCLKLLPEGTVIHRMTGDGPRRLLLSPAWVTDKKRVMNLLHKKIREI